jgi:hypothetical protein
MLEVALANLCLFLIWAIGSEVLGRILREVLDWLEDFNTILDAWDERNGRWI